MAKNKANIDSSDYVIIKPSEFIGLHIYKYSLY